MKRLLICGTGSGMERSIPLLRGIVDEIVVVTDRPLDAAPFADIIIEAYPREESQVIAAVKTAGISDISGVFSLGYENPRVIACLCEKYGLPGLNYKVMETSALKDRRIKALSAGGVPVPVFVVAQGEKQAFGAIRQIGYPCIIKPNDKTSSIGVAVILNEENEANLVRRALQNSETETVIVEQYIDGSEHTVEGLITDGKIYVTGFSDRNYAEKHRFPPFVFENGDNLPSALDPEKKRQIVEVAKQAVYSLGYNNTAFHGDFLFSTEGKAIVLELTPRLSGARFGTELVPLSTGVNILRNAVRLCLSEPINLDELIETISPPNAVVARFLPSPGGHVRWVGDLSSLKNNAGVYDISWEMPLSQGLYLKPYEDGKGMIVSVIAVGLMTCEAEQKANAVLSKLPLKIEIDLS